MAGSSESVLTQQLTDDFRAARRKSIVPTHFANQKQVFLPISRSMRQRRRGLCQPNGDQREVQRTKILQPSFICTKASNDNADVAINEASIFVEISCKPNAHPVRLLDSQPEASAFFFFFTLAHSAPLQQRQGSAGAAASQNRPPNGGALCCNRGGSS